MDIYNPIGQVVGIYIKDKEKGPVRSLVEGFFEKDRGLLGDIHSKGGNRQVSIFTLEGYNEILSSNMEGLCSGRFYENIRVKGLDLDKIKIGSILKIGESIQEVTEIGKSCFPECNLVKEGRSCPLSSQVIFTKVIKGGRIGVGNMVIMDRLHNYICSIIQQIPKGVIITDLDGNIKFVNTKGLNMFGYELWEMEERRAHDLFKGWYHVKETILSGNIYEDEVYVNARTNRLWFNLKASPLIDGKGEVMDIIHVFDDHKKERKLAGRLTKTQAVYTFDKIIGEDKKFKEMLNFCKKIADSKSTILITGESGTGKEILAQSIHNYSNRRDKPFVAINSGAIPKTLIESELFGYVEGAFTGAIKGGRPGKFEIAHGGTIFLDEIGEMPLDMQIRLLRIIEEGTVSRIGATDQKYVDVRIIAASNKDLLKEVEKGNFREDLFYRLNVLPIKIPPLRERKGDIPLLIDHFMERISKRLNKKPIPISEEEMEELINYHWPGNVRELENFIELAINMEYIPKLGWGEYFKDNTKEYKDIEYRDLSLENMEKNHIIKVLKLCSGNITHAAKALGIGRNTLYRKIKKYNIDCSQ